MTIRHISIAAVLAAAISGVRADTAVCTSAGYGYAVDTRFLHVVKSMDDLTSITSGIRKVGWSRSDTVSVSAPDGTACNFVERASGAGSAVPPVDGGGIWVFASSKYGTFEIAIRHSLYGTFGNGTIENPFNMVERDEMAELFDSGTITTKACYFTLPSTVPVMAPPEGYGLADMGGGLWNIALAPDGRRYTCAARGYSADSRKTGPDRTVYLSDIRDVAFSGDVWTRRNDNASTLTVTTPSGAETLHALNGTDVLPVAFNQRGRWTVSLQSDYCATTSQVLVVSRVFSLILR